MILSPLSLFFSRKILPGLKIKSNELVIDIGSGDKPFWRGDVFVDKLSLGNVQRTSNTATIRSIGTFVDGDVVSLPFKDKTFDFSFCSHLLEHVDNPEKVIKEIVRVSKAGYLEVPNGILETIKPFHTHLWFVFNDNGKLVFVRKSKKQHELYTQNGKRFGELLKKIDSPFIQLYWKKNIKYEIIDTLTKKEKFQSATDKANISYNVISPYLLLVKLLRFIFWKQKRTPEVVKN